MVVGAKIEYKITIPCKPLVKQYLHYVFGERVVLDQSHQEGKFLLLCMEKIGRYRDTLAQPENYTESIDVYLSEWQVDHFGLTLTPTAIMEINEGITRKVYSLLFFFYRGFSASDQKFGSIGKSIRMFKEQFGFCEDSLPYDSARKSLYRMKKNPKKVKNYV